MVLLPVSRPIPIENALQEFLVAVVGACPNTHPKKQIRSTQTSLKNLRNLEGTMAVQLTLKLVLLFDRPQCSRTESPQGFQP